MVSYSLTTPTKLPKELLILQVHVFLVDNSAFFFENYPSKNLEIRQFIRIFAENLAPRARNPKQKPNTLVIITNKPKISLTELQELDTWGDPILLDRVSKYC